MEENGSLVKFIFNLDREVIAEKNSLGITRYIRSSELIARNTDAARTYYHYVSDEMGSTTHIVDEDGIVLNHYTYDAWGNITAQKEAVPNRFKFTGQQLDPVTQQYYLRARFYNPVIARFTQEDTYRGDGLNLYAYCANNPIYYIDPSGFDKDTLILAQKKYSNIQWLDGQGQPIKAGDLTPHQFGALSEKIAAHYASAQYPGYTYVGSTKIGSNNGFDYVLSKNITLTDGTAAKEFIIVGIRTGANPQLNVLSGQSTDGMVQMSQRWINMNINRLRHSRNATLRQLGHEMGKETSIIRTDIAVVRPAGNEGRSYELEFLGQQNTQDLIDATLRRVQNKTN